MHNLSKHKMKPRLQCADEKIGFMYTSFFISYKMQGKQLCWRVIENSFASVGRLAVDTIN